MMWNIAVHWLVWHFANNVSRVQFFTVSEAKWKICFRAEASEASCTGGWSEQMSVMSSAVSWSVSYWYTCSCSCTKSLCNLKADSQPADSNLKKRCSTTCWWLLLLIECCSSWWPKDRSCVREAEKAKRRILKALAVRWLWLLADENRSLDTISGCDCTPYRDERLPLCCVCLHTVPSFTFP